MSDEISVYTIYKSPRDYPPGTYVVRRWEIFQTLRTMEAVAYPTLAAARAAIPAGLVNIGRDKSDDAAILEVWL